MKICKEDDNKLLYLIIYIIAQGWVLLLIYSLCIYVLHIKVYTHSSRTVKGEKKLVTDDNNRP